MLCFDDFAVSRSGGTRFFSCLFAALVLSALALFGCASAPAAAASEDSSPASAPEPEAASAAPASSADYDSWLGEGDTQGFVSRLLDERGQAGKEGADYDSWLGEGDGQGYVDRLLSERAEAEPEAGEEDAGTEGLEPLSNALLRVFAEGGELGNLKTKDIEGLWFYLSCDVTLYGKREYFRPDNARGRIIGETKTSVIVIKKGAHGKIVGVDMKRRMLFVNFLGDDARDSLPFVMPAGTDDEGKFVFAYKTEQKQFYPYDDGVVYTVSYEGDTPFLLVGVDWQGVTVISHAN